MEKDTVISLSISTSSGHHFSCSGPSSEVLKLYAEWKQTLAELGLVHA